MMLIGLALTPFTARLGERFGRPSLIATGLAAMTSGLVVLALLSATTPPWALGPLMILVGLGGPLVMPPTMAVLLDLNGRSTTTTVRSVPTEHPSLQALQAGRGTWSTAALPAQPGRLPHPPLVSMISVSAAVRSAVHPSGGAMWAHVSTVDAP